MAMDKFWKDKADRDLKEENRCKELFNTNGKEYSYSRSEVNVLRRLGLLPKSNK